MTDLCLTGATVVLPGGAQPADVLVAGETIEGITAPGTGRAAATIDLAGRILLPGGIDPHVHMMVAFMGQPSVYDFASGGIAALRGGTTAVIDFALQRRGKPALAGLAHRRRQAANASVDLGLHQIVTEVTDDLLAELPQLAAEGVTSLKVYMTYEAEGLRLDDGALYRLMQVAAAAGLLLCLHAENHEIVERLRRDAVAAGHTAPIWHARTRPPVTETDAIARVIALSRATGCAVHILHLAAAESLPLIAAARAEGLDVTAETCTHYLALDESRLEGAEAADFVVSPPLRPKGNEAALWAALAGGTLSLIASDEVSYPAAAKRMPGLPFDRIANGCPGVEARLPVAWTLGVDAGRITPERFAELWAGAAARRFGIARKGRIAPGMDADLVAIDPLSRRVMTAADHWGPIGYTPFEGWS